MAPDLMTITPSNPFSALNPHFGLLLGVEDLFTLQGYAAGKARLHNAWLHRAGVVWGLAVSFNARRELQVEPGLALDGLGRELHVDTPQCVELGRWYADAKARGLPDLPPPDATTGLVMLEAHVVLCFQACLSKAVPAIADTCGTSQITTAFSRITEGVHLQLRLGKAPAPAAPYHRLRVLFGLEAGDPVADTAVLARRAAIQSLAPAAQPAALLTALRFFAALDVMSIVPAQGATNPSYPEAEPGCVVLSELTATLASSSTGWQLLGSTTTPLAADPVVRNEVRPSHVATSTIQELLCGPIGTAASGSPPPLPADAGGPRIDPASVTLSGTTLTFSTTVPLARASVDRDAFGLNAFLTTGWAGIDLQSAVADAARTTVTLELKEAPVTGSWLRLVVAGTGQRPLLGEVGADLIPLAGPLAGASGSKVQGNDFIHFWKVI